MNVNKKPIAPYYKRVLELITFEKVDDISMDEVKRVADFFERSVFGNSKFIDVEKIRKLVK